MRFCVLGPVSVATGDHRELLARGRRRLILALLLAAEGATVSTDSLVDGVWGANPPETARKSLQSHISRLRLELQSFVAGEPQPLVSDPDGYHVNLFDHELDAVRFRGLVDRARRSDSQLEALSLLEEAARCWGGPAFGDLASHPGIAASARRLDQLWSAAVADRIDALLAVGRHDEALDTLPGIVERDPYDEHAHGQLMRALVAAGRQAEALSTFDDLRDRLRDELGVDPSPPLQTLHEEVLRQDVVTPISPGQARAGAAVRSGVMTAGHRSDPLLGRDRDVETLSTWVRSAPLITLTGPGGVGKTRLAEHVIQRVGERWQDGVVTCALAHVRDESGVGGALITALGTQPSGHRSVAEALVTALGERRLLLFLDNCEHVLEALSPLAEAILAGCPAVTVVATSRERLRLPGEHVWPVAPLEVPSDGANVAQVLSTSAGSLFQLRAGAVDPSFRLTDGNAHAVVELCRRLDGMPLAIELAAARTGALAPAELVVRLDRRFAVLAGGPRSDGGRHRTLEAVVAWSYDLLGPAEADLFDRLSVFAGAVPLSTIEDVCSDGALPKEQIAGLLGELVDQSMVVVQRDGDDVRYRLLDTMRGFGLQRLTERGLTDSLRRAHASHYVQLAETYGAAIRGSDEQAAEGLIAGAIDDLRAAHMWSVAAGEVHVALRIPAALATEVFFRLRDELTTWARRSLALPGADHDPSYAAALIASAMGATSRDECERAMREASLALTYVESDSLVAVMAAGVLATAALYEGRLDDVLELSGWQAEIADNQGDDFHRASARVCQVLGHLYRDEHDAAEALLPDLRGIADNSGNPTMRAFARYCDGEVHLETQPDRAVPSLREAAELARGVGNELLQGVSLVCLASLEGRRGNTDEALQVFRDVVAHWRQLGDYTHQLTTLRNLVELLAQIAADEPAAILYGAVTGGDTPTFGAEAERLAAAWERVEQRLGQHEARQFADWGGQLSATGMADEALGRLDSLLGR